MDDCNTPEKLETMVRQNLGWGRGWGGGGERCIMVYVKVVNVANDLSPKPSQEAKVSCHKIAKVNDCELLYSSMELKMRNCDQILKDMQLPT